MVSSFLFNFHWSTGFLERWAQIFPIIFIRKWFQFPDNYPCPADFANQFNWIGKRGGGYFAAISSTVWRITAYPGFQKPRKYNRAPIKQRKEVGGTSGRHRSAPQASIGIRVWFESYERGWSRWLLVFEIYNDYLEAAPSFHGVYWG